MIIEHLTCTVHVNTCFRTECSVLFKCATFTFPDWYCVVHNTINMLLIICVWSSKVEAVLLPASISFLIPLIIIQSRNSYNKKTNKPLNVILNIHPSPNMYNYYNYVTYFSKRDTFTQKIWSNVYIPALGHHSTILYMKSMN